MENVRVGERKQRWRSGAWQTAARAGLLVCILGVPVQAGGFDRNAWLQDYVTLKRALEERYSNLAWFASPEGGVDLPGLDRRTLAALRTAASDADAREALSSFVRTFHDGHFSQLPTLAPGGKTATPEAPELERNDAATGCAALNFGPDDLPQFSLPFEALPHFRLLADGITTPFRAGIVRVGEDGIRVGIVRIASFEETADQGLCLEAWTRDDVWDGKGHLIRPHLKDIVERAWYESLAGMLRKFKTEGVEAVLVDVGNNSGGDDSGDIAARLFTARPLRSAALWVSQNPAAAGAYFDEQLEALREAQTLAPASQPVETALATFAKQKEALSRNTCALGWVWKERRSWRDNNCRRLVEAGSAGGPLDHLIPGSADDIEVERRLHWPAIVAPLQGTWSGPVYVLTNNKTYSAAEMFAAVLQNNAAATIVGGQTGGDGCGFMNNPGPVVLPHSQLRFRVPNCVRMRADGTDEVAGVRPDIPILPADGENAKARAMRLLDAVRASLKKSAAPLR